MTLELQLKNGNLATITMPRLDEGYLSLDHALRCLTHELTASGRIVPRRFLTLDDGSAIAVSRIIGARAV